MSTTYHKIILLDFDGVISPGPMFGDVYGKEFGVDPDVMKPFFKNKKPLTNTGEADLKELLKDELENWGWDGTVDELVDYWNQADSEIDQDVVDYAKRQRAAGKKLYLATDQEPYRTEFIWETRGLRGWLDGRFVSFEVGFVKSDPQFFEYIIAELGVKPKEILFYDDSESKIESALSVGIDARLYKTSADLEKTRYN